MLEPDDLDPAAKGRDSPEHPFEIANADPDDAASSTERGQLPGSDPAPQSVDADAEHLGGRG